jgi:hypothetical protein
LVVLASDRTVKIIDSDESLTLSTTNPLGTRDEIRKQVRMALFLQLANPKTSAEFIGSESDPKLDAD